jgi:hypothetical protein
MMMGEIKKYVLIDTGYWRALLQKSDSYHQNALDIQSRIERFYYRLPWPTLYEFINTKFVKNLSIMAQFNKLLASPGVIRDDDMKYREKSLELSLGRGSSPRYWQKHEKRPTNERNMENMVVHEWAANYIWTLLLPFLATHAKLELLEVA